MTVILVVNIYIHVLARSNSFQSVRADVNAFIENKYATRRRASHYKTRRRNRVLSAGDLSPR